LKTHPRIKVDPVEVGSLDVDCVEVKAAEVNPVEVNAAEVNSLPWLQKVQHERCMPPKVLKPWIKPTCLLRKPILEQDPFMKTGIAH
jgi:hypothetical protein